MKTKWLKSPFIKAIGNLYYAALQAVSLGIVRHLVWLEKKIGRSRRGFTQDCLIELCNNQWHTVNLGGDGSTDAPRSSLKLCVSNSLLWFRADTFHTKEPETLGWINSMEQGATLWDVGANVGLYSLYAAQVRQTTVYAFEPSVFNLEMLAKNIFANDLENKIIIVPVPLSDVTECSTFKLSNICNGSACSTFGKDFGFDGNPLETAFAYSTVGSTGNFLVANGVVPVPDYIKIDVDGIEHLVLSGMKDVLSNAKVKSVLIEGNDDFYDQVATISDIMQKSGFVLQQKVHSEMFSGDTPFSNTYNQIWVRSA